MVQGTQPDTGIAVVGGGVVGLACASELWRRGFQVQVFEPRPLEDRTSYGNAGALSRGSVAPFGMPGLLRKVPSMLLDRNGSLHIQPSYAIKAMPWLVRFLRASRRDRVERISRALAALHERALTAYAPLLEFAGASDLLRTTGQLHVYPDRTALDGDDGAWALRRARGVNFEVLDRSQLATLEPALSERYALGVFMPDEAMITSPAQLLDKLRGALRDAGVDIWPVAVDTLKVEANGRIGVVCGAERWSYGAVVVAAGAWSQSLCRQLGHRVPLESQRGYHLMYPASEVSLSRPVTAADRKIFASPLEGGTRIAGTVEFAGLSRPANQARIDALRVHGQAMLPGLPAGDARPWMGHRPCLPDSLPVIGRSRHCSSVYFAFGHGHLGLTGAAVTGELIAKLAAGEDVDIDLAPFDIDRF